MMKIPLFSWALFHMKIGAIEINTLIYEGPLFLEIDSMILILDGET